jgi:hypothetical protein
MLCDRDVAHMRSRIGLTTTTSLIAIHERVEAGRREEGAHLVHRRIKAVPIISGPLVVIVGR